MHDDVVQIAKTILHVLQGRQEGLATLFLLFSRKPRLIEFRSVTQFFGLDPQLLPRLRIEFCQYAAPFPDLFPASRQLRAGQRLDRLLATLPREFVSRLAPAADVEPRGGVQRQVAKSPARDRRQCARCGGVTAVPPIRRQASPSPQPPMPFFHRSPPP